MSGFYSLEGLRRSREEREQQRAGQAQGCLLADVPADAPYEDPDAVIHVWAGKQWISYQKWLATAPIVVEQMPAPIAPPKEETKEAVREPVQVQLPMEHGNHG